MELSGSVIIFERKRKKNSDSDNVSIPPFVKDIAHALILHLFLYVCYTLKRQYACTKIKHIFDQT